MQYRIVMLLVLALCLLSRSGQPASASASAVQSRAESIQQINDRFVGDILRRIAGHETEPASQVFKNIQMFKTTQARLLLTIMSVGYAPALGVACTHCHVETDFASDEKRPKRAAREMAAMHRSINDQLAKMQNLATPATQNRAINCSTCHRGAVNPMQAGG